MIRTIEQRRRISEGTKKAMKRPEVLAKILGKNNSQWKGDDVSYVPLHSWVNRHKPKPKFCELCRKKPPYDLANISGKYKRDIDDFEWLCRSCHMKKDGRLLQLHKHGNKGWRSKKTHCPNGHSFSGYNLIMQKFGYRRCRECHRIDSLKRYYKLHPRKPDVKS